jgi:hypothetical protein
MVTEESVKRTQISIQDTTKFEDLSSDVVVARKEGDDDVSSL